MSFKIDTEKSRRGTLKEARQAALRIMLEYEIEWSSIRFIQLSEHITYRIESETGEQFLLRIHPASKRYEEVISELEWLSALESASLDVPAGVPNRHGALVTTTTLNDGPGMYGSLLRWVEGEGKEKGALSAEVIRNMGAMMATLHEASAHFRPSSRFVRPVWGSESLARDWEHLRQHRMLFISDEAIELYSAAYKKAAAQLEGVNRHDRNYGMIHADLHLGNFVFRNDEPFAIDFGRCGFGYHLYDIAQAIMGLYPVQRTYFIEGYETVRKLDDDPIPALECFFIMAIIEAYSFHAENPLETDNLIEEQSYAQAIFRSFVNGTPFLFQPLEY